MRKRIFAISLAIVFVFSVTSNAQKRPKTRVSHPKPTPVASPTLAAKPGDVRKNPLGMELVWVPPGKFMMGSSDTEVNATWEQCKEYYAQCSRNGFAAEQPKHLVTIKNGFWMGRFEVTRVQWRSVMNGDPSSGQDCGEDCPVDSVSWDDVQIFLRSLNEKNDGFSYSLPTEAEWEYAARAGTTTAYAFGNSLTLSQANFNTEHPYKFTKPAVRVGSYKPNAWGLYDMHGNVWEWVQDIYNSSYDGLPTDGSANLSYGNANQRVIRGGSWQSEITDVRSANRLFNFPTAKDYSLGLRIVARPRNGKAAKPQPTEAGMTVGQIIAPFLLPAGRPDTEIKWSALDNLTDVIWKDKAPVKYTNPIEDTEGLYRTGSTDLGGRGNVSVSFSGSETAVSAVSFLFAGGGILPFGFAEFSKVLREQFGPEASIKLLRRQCPNELSDVYKSGYKIVLKGKKPIYVFLQAVISPNHPDLGYSYINISRVMDEDWKCKSN